MSKDIVSLHNVTLVSKENDVVVATASNSDVLSAGAVTAEKEIFNATYTANGDAVAETFIFDGVTTTLA